MTNKRKHGGVNHKAPVNKGASGTRKVRAVSAQRGVFGCLKRVLKLLLYLVERLDALIELLRPSISCYNDVVLLVREVRYDDVLGIRSIPKAVWFIRVGVKPDSPYYERCVNARMCVRRRAKKCIDGEEKAWRSIAKMAQPSQAKKKRSKRAAAPGPVPIPDKSWANGIHASLGIGPWNNPFP